MRDVTASLAQLTVTNDVTERELNHDVNETGDFDAGDNNFDRCTIHPGQKRDVYCNNCQEEVMNYVNQILFDALKLPETRLIVNNLWKDINLFSMWLFFCYSSGP